MRLFNIESLSMINYTYIYSYCFLSSNCFSLQDCPIESLSSIATAFIELDAAAASAAAETPHEKKEDVLISPMMANIINDVLQTMG